MKGVQLETPSRIWRRIEAVEDEDMPSLPSFPAYEDSDAPSMSSDAGHDSEEFIPLHSTPTVQSSDTATATMRAPSSTSSAARFAQSIASRSTTTRSGYSVSRTNSSRKHDHESFDVSSIASLPDPQREVEADELEGNAEEEGGQNPNADLLPVGNIGQGDDDPPDLSLSEALESVSRSNSPVPHPSYVPGSEPTPRKNYDYSVSLRSEPKASPFDKLRNISFRKPLARTRTPSLSRTTPSPASTSPNSTPHSSRSIDFSRADVVSPLPATYVPLPRSATVSPAPGVFRRREESIISVVEAMTDEERHVTGAIGLQEPEAQSEVQDTESQTGSEPDLSQHEYENPGAQNETDRERDHSQGDEKEPTFSSEEGPTELGRDNDFGRQKNSIRSPTPLSTAFSSPAPSVMFTPTPAFQARPRPRARFNLPTSPGNLLDNIGGTGQRAYEYETASEYEHPQEAEEGGEDPATPYSHKRSFLLSVINSTVRPRMKFPTPHPNHVNASNASTSISTQFPTPAGVKLFAGVTPRPRPKAAPRSSHPLAQAWTTADDGADSGSDEVLTQSPYDSAGERASFISTASSHDLTTHARANASFDPLVGLGAQGHGVGRFNAGKLNTYLHGLNRRLQEENETLVMRLRSLEEDRKPGGPVSRRTSGGGRRVSAVSPLGDVDEGAWVEEKAVLEDKVEELTEKLEVCIEEKEKMDKALEAERAERTRDKERWKERMGEVERGVGDIVKGLEKKLRDAESKNKIVEDEIDKEIKSVHVMLSEVQDDRDMALARAEKAERVLESGQELGTELREANDRVSQVMCDLRNANMQIKQLEEEVLRSDERLDALEQQVEQEKDATRRVAEELQFKSDESADASKRLADMEEERNKMAAELRDARVYLADMEVDGGAAVERIENLEEQLDSAHQKILHMEREAHEAADVIESLEAEFDKLGGETERASELARQMEEALEAAEMKMLDDEQGLAQLKTKVTALERELEKKADPSRSMGRMEDPDSDVVALEAELEDACREIARLNAILQQSPARKAIEKSKDAKIEMLESEREELLERIASLKTNIAAVSTPGKLANGSRISPMYRHVLSFKSPKTPGAPLRDLSWLQNTEMDQSAAPLLVEISRLQRELDRANESIDEKIDKLEDAGLGVVELTKKLEDARNRIVVLEDEIARLARRDERRLRRLQRARCLKCLGKVDLRDLNRAGDGDESSVEIMMPSLALDPPTPPTKTSEALRANVQAVNAQLESMKKQWIDEKRQLLGEKAVLQDAAKRLNVQVLEAHNEVKRITQSELASKKAKCSVETELEKAKRSMLDLEEQLKEERSRLRSLTSERNIVEREKGDILLQLQRTESDMDEVREMLQNAKQENHDLEAELRVNTNAEQRARLLDTKVAQNVETIEHLREERSILAADHRDLQRRFTEVSERLNKLRDEFAASQTSHENRRHELDMQVLEIEDLRQALSSQASELQRTEAEKNHMASERSDIVRTVAALQDDLRRVKKEAEAFGRDLKQLRAEKLRLEAKCKEEVGKARRKEKQTDTQIRVLGEQLKKAKKVTEDVEGHVCPANEQQLSAMKLRHNKECKGLIVQIRYLKAKFTRETVLRCNLGYQKSYLLVLLAKFEKSEQRISAAIARIGFAVPPPISPQKDKRRSLKCVALSVLFMLRIKRTSDAWRAESGSRQAIADALTEVRKRRTVPYRASS